MLTDRERDELLIRMDERTMKMQEALERDFKSLYGNGQPGLIERVRDLSTTCKELKGKLEDLEKIPARVQTLENYHTNENSFIRKCGAVIAWLVTAALALYSALKHH